MAGVAHAKPDGIVVAGGAAHDFGPGGVALRRGDVADGARVADAVLEEQSVAASRKEIPRRVGMVVLVA